MTKTFQIQAIDPPNPEWDNQVRQGLYQHNRAKVGSRHFHELSVILQEENGRVVGGVVGGTIWGWFLVEAVWVADELRGQGYGRQLLARAEEVARSRGCGHAILDTFTFQALPFYQEQGYVIYGQLDGFPAGHTRYSLKKDLAAPQPAESRSQSLEALYHLAPQPATSPNEYLEVLHQITLDLLNRRSLHELLQVIVERAAAILDAPYGELMLLEGDELVVRAYTRNQPYLLGDRVRRGEAMVTWRAFDTGQPVLIDDYFAWSGRRVIYDEAQLQAVGDFPVIVGQTSVGVLAMARVKPDYPFSPEDVHRGIQFSQLAALVLDNARLYDTALHEITERERAEEQLKDLMLQQQIVLDNTPVGIAFQKEHHIAWANDVATAMSGYNGEEIKTLHVLFPDSDPKAFTRFSEEVNQRLARGEIFTTELPLRRKDGTLFWCNLTGQAINPQNLHQEGIIWVVQDITARRQAEEQIRQLSRAVEASPASIVITDLQGCIQYVNPKFTEVTGYTMAEARGQNPRILKTERTPPEVHRDLWQTLKSGREWRGEFVNRKKNGEYYWEFASISPIIGPDGAISHYVAVKEDITERKRLEEELARARDQALEASRYKTELIAKVSHELRTPLGAILGYTEFLDKETFGPLTPRQKHFTTEILNSTIHLNGLISDLLDEAQIERGQIRIQPAPFDPRQMIERLALTLEPQAQAKGLALTTEVDPELPAVLLGDEKRLHQVLTNLAGNAIKFTETGGVTVRIRPAGANQWQMQVIDTGPGIPPEAQAKIFDSFWQANRSLTQKQKGYGLGLSIVKQLTELLGGEILVESEPGRGSSFTVLLPLEMPTDEPTPLQDNDNI